MHNEGPRQLLSLLALVIAACSSSEAKREAPPVARVAAPTSSGVFTRGVLGHIAYGFALPSGYRRVDASPDLHRWEPSSGIGMIYELRVHPRTAGHEGNVWKIPACRPDELAGREGAERKVSVTIQWCLAETSTEPSDRFECLARHTRGHLEGSEPELGLRVCRTLEASRRAGMR